MKIALDGVCSVASEEIRQEEWGIDVVLSATQKGLGTPPGLSVLSASPRAVQTLEARKTPVTSYYASWKRYNFLPSLSKYLLLITASFKQLASNHACL